jgi:glucose/arabinose dehydrogenase
MRWNELRPRTRWTMAATLAGLACADPPAAPDDKALLARPGSDSEKCDADNGGLILPTGFCAVVVAKDLGRARHMAQRPNGDLYVAINNTPGTEDGGVTALRDTDGDGRADVMQRFGPEGGNGVAWGEGQLYFSPDDRVIRFTFNGNELGPTGAQDIIVSGLADTDDHPRKTVVLDGSGGMFVNIASGSNSCQVEDRTDLSPGIDPCPELPVRAGVWHFSATTLGQTLASGTHFASELRNMNALAINPADGKLYGAQNGRDQLFDNWSTFFDERDDAMLPAEELFVIEQGKKYGWPYCYYDGVKNKKVLAPEYGGDGAKVGRCADRELPLADYPAHWAPLGMTFYTGTQFPSRYLGGLFIAWHGSRFDSRLQPAGPGYVVTFTPWVSGKPSGKFETFADGFTGGDASPTGAAHRPVSVTQATDGSLYISDDRAGWIWRVFYVGNGR